MKKRTLEEYFEESKNKAKRAGRRVKTWFSDRAYDVKMYCFNHPEEALGIGCLTLVVIGNVVTKTKKAKALEKEEELKEEYCYDRSLGHYWRLRRKISNDEWLEINRRKNEGESLGEILEQLRLLK